MFASLMLCINTSTTRDANNNCLLHLDSVFIWTDETRVKLSDNVDKRIRFLLQMLELF